jgi:hypothetical protein
MTNLFLRQSKQLERTELMRKKRGNSSDFILCWRYDLNHATVSIFVCLIVMIVMVLWGRVKMVGYYRISFFFSCCEASFPACLKYILNNHDFFFFLFPIIFVLSNIKNERCQFFHVATYLICQYYLWWCSLCIIWYNLANWECPLSMFFSGLRAMLNWLSDWCLLNGYIFEAV